MNQNITVLPGGAGTFPFNGVGQPAGANILINDSFNILVHKIRLINVAAIIEETGEFGNRSKGVPRRNETPLGSGGPPPISGISSQSDFTSSRHG